MFNVGGGEILVILLIALIVLGPQRLPDAARQVGKVMGDLRKLSSGFQNEMKSALSEADDPNRVAARRNVLATDAPAPEAPVEEAEAPVAAAVAAVSTRPAGPAKKTAPARAQTTSATKRAPAKKAAATKASPAKKPAAKKAKAPAKAAKATTNGTKRAAPAKKVVSKAARPRSTR